MAWPVVGNRSLAAAGWWMMTLSAHSVQNLLEIAARQGQIDQRHRQSLIRRIFSSGCVMGALRQSVFASCLVASTKCHSAMPLSPRAMCDLFLDSSVRDACFTGQHTCIKCRACTAVTEVHLRLTQAGVYLGFLSLAVIVPSLASLGMNGCHCDYQLSIHCAILCE